VTGPDRVQRQQHRLSHPMRIGLPRLPDQVLTHRQTPQAFQVPSVPSRCPAITAAACASPSGRLSRPVTVTFWWASASTRAASSPPMLASTTTACAPIFLISHPLHRAAGTPAGRDPVSGSTACRIHLRQACSSTKKSHAAGAMASRQAYTRAGGSSTPPPVSYHPEHCMGSTLDGLAGGV